MDWVISKEATTKAVEPSETRSRANDMRTPPNRVGLQTLRGTPIEELRRMYWDEDMSLDQIAKKFSVSFNSVRQHFNRIGVQRRGRTDAMKLGWRHLSPESRAKILSQSRRNISHAHKDPEVRAATVSRCVARNSTEEQKTFSRKSMLLNSDDKLQILLYRVLRRVLPDVKVRLDKPVCSFHYFLDIAFPTQKLGIEIDGNRTHLPEHAEADKARQRRIEKRGWKLYRVGHQEMVMDFLGVLGRIVSLVYASRSTSAQQSERPKLRLVI